MSAWFTSRNSVHQCESDMFICWLIHPNYCEVFIWVMRFRAHGTLNSLLMYPLPTSTSYMFICWLIHPKYCEISIWNMRFHAHGTLHGLPMCPLPTSKSYMFICRLMQLHYREVSYEWWGCSQSHACRYLSPTLPSPTLDQCCRFSRNTAQVTPKNIQF